MEARNHTEVSEFLLLGLSEDPELQPLLFGVFLSMYLVTVFGNLLIILTISSDSHLHTPMYFFLSNLSFVDVCFISTTIPKMLVNIQAQRKDISYIGCFTQVYFFMIFAGMDNFLLTVMAYDRFVAICHPLHYMVIMNPRLCVLLVLLSWFIIFWVSVLHILLLRRLTFCIGTEIPHFFCELAQVVKSACSNTLINNITMYVITAVVVVFPFTGILFSYSRIVSSIMRISSAGGKYKAFSACGSHLSVVSLFYGTGLGVYLSSAVTHSSHRSSIASLMYTVVTPMLNPFIYSLRNKNVKGALGRLLSWPDSSPSRVTGLRTKWTWVAPQNVDGVESAGKDRVIDAVNIPFTLPGFLSPSPLHDCEWPAPAGTYFAQHMVLEVTENYDPSETAFEDECAVAMSFTH
ncbi:PREDICTED: olfactory receptor 7D4-like [Ceratotherium simum simum]|uniref:Olfactory receptor 7D4-like n=1 Tax=Ceratotherium simum simum TaxID=73337 RepID=A0ABM0HUT5_CERSS|nr:PREDICTED: olfactory receptor 7D4-like [Ceratotherium simum simum]